MQNQQVGKIAHLNHSPDADLSEGRDLEVMQVRTVSARSTQPFTHSDELSALMGNWVSQSIDSERQFS